jgi:hypothetical protein
MNNRITILFNIRLNSDYRLKRFIKSIELIKDSNTTDLSIRIRGSHAKVAIKYAEVLLKNHSGNISFWEQSSYQNWKLDTLEQVRADNNQFFFITQEDHLLNTGIEFFDQFNNELIKIKPDFIPVSFFQNYNFIKPLLPLDKHKSGETMNYWSITKSEWQNTQKIQKFYLLSFVGIYEISLLKHCLKSEKPYIKRFSVNSPYHFEKREIEDSVFPIRFALPKKEIYCCIDDDHGFPGSSLISKGLYNFDVERSIEHHKVNVPKYLMNLKLFLLNCVQNSNILKKTLLFTKLKLLYSFRCVIYTIHAVLTYPRRYQIKKKMIN